MSAASKERQKLTANWLNTLSGGSLAAGVLTPVIAYQNGLSPNQTEAAIISNSAIWVLVAIVLHIFALAYLIGLEE